MNSGDVSVNVEIDRWQSGMPDVDEILLQRHWLKPDQAWYLLYWLRCHIPWRQLPVKLFGRSYLQPRLCALVAEQNQLTYTYSGLTLRAMVWPEVIAEIRERLLSDCGVRFNACLLNLYRNQSDCMGMHADNEPELGNAPQIAIVSLGGERFIRFKHRRFSRAGKIRLEHGSLLWMRPPCQSHWLHGIPRQAHAKPRISLTFRQIFQ